jgi:thiamine pyrophosphokinase
MRAVIFANGRAADMASAEELCRRADLIVAVDGGLIHCHHLGITPHVLLGDLDSARPQLVRQALAAGAHLEQHPVDKDKTDLELALDLCCRRGVTDIDLFAALGGRWDMSLANIFLLAAPRYSDVTTTIHQGATSMQLLRGPGRLKLTLPADTTVSLLPLTDDVKGLSLEGFKYPLKNALLAFGSTRCISNQPAGATSRICLARGTILITVEQK